MWLSRRPSALRDGAHEAEAARRQALAGFQEDLAEGLLALLRVEHGLGHLGHEGVRLLPAALPSHVGEGRHRASEAALVVDEGTGGHEHRNGVAVPMGEDEVVDLPDARTTTGDLIGDEGAGARRNEVRDRVAEHVLHLVAQHGRHGGVHVAGPLVFVDEPESLLQGLAEGAQLLLAGADLPHLQALAVAGPEEHGQSSCRGKGADVVPGVVGGRVEAGLEALGTSGGEGLPVLHLELGALRLGEGLVEEAPSEHVRCAPSQDAFRRRVEEPHPQLAVEEEEAVVQLRQHAFQIDHGSPLRETELRLRRALLRSREVISWRP